jgi:hypothetical protein
MIQKVEDEHLKYAPFCVRVRFFLRCFQACFIKRLYLCRHVTNILTYRTVIVSE